MASGGILLAAKQGDPAVPSVPLQPVYPIEKRPGSLDPRVIDPTICIVELLLYGPSAQFEAEE